VPTFTQALGTVSDSFGEAAVSAEEAFKETDAYYLLLMELASNERIALIEAKVAIDVAQIQADAQTVVAAFDSINTSIDSTAATLMALYGLLGDQDSNLSWFSQELQRAIAMEESYRQQSFELQQQLIEAQIELLRQRAEALERGDALIQVDGAGLQPHLEAFMWEILRTIQVRVNEDGLEMLLGVA